MKLGPNARATPPAGSQDSEKTISMVGTHEVVTLNEHPSTDQAELAQVEPVITVAQLPVVAEEEVPVTGRRLWLWRRLLRHPLL